MVTWTCFGIRENVNADELWQGRVRQAPVRLDPTNHWNLSTVYECEDKEECLPGTFLQLERVSGSQLYSEPTSGTRLSLGLGKGTSQTDGWPVDMAKHHLGDISL